MNTASLAAMLGAAFIVLLGAVNGSVHSISAISGGENPDQAKPNNPKKESRK